MTDLISRDRFTCLTCGTVHYSSDAYVACRDSHPPPSLVDRLRFGSIDDDLLDAAKESADMIERLRAENSRMNTLLLDVQRRLDAATDDAERLRELLAEPQGEPVAYIHEWKSHANVVGRTLHWQATSPHGDDVKIIPLYTHPPQQRQPLTVGQIKRIAAQCESGACDQSQTTSFARAVERAHGIVEAP